MWENFVTTPFLDFVWHYKEIILIVSSISSLFFGWILYSSANAGIGRWIRLLGWFFFTFVLMYGLKSVFLIYDLKNAEPVFQIRNFYGLLITDLNQILSTINNLLMLLAAKELLSTEAKTESETKEFFLYSFINQIRTFIPRKIKILAVIATILPFIQPVISWLTQDSSEWLLEFFIRLPDAAFSAYCFIYLGYAFWINITFLRQKWVAIFGLFPTLYYAFSQLIYIAIPIVIQSDKQNRWNMGVFAISLPLKVAIFLTAYYLGIKTLQVLKGIYKTIDRVANTRQNFLSRTGIIESIGETLSAESVTLFIRMPSKKSTKVTRMKWYRKWDPERDIESSRPDLKKYPKIKKIFENGKSTNYKSDWKTLPKVFARKKHRVVSIYIPMLFNGAVIGCLEVVLNEFAANTNIVIKQIENFANRLSTAVQGYREGLSLKHATYRCATYQFYNVENGSVAIDEITKTIDDILAPEGIRIFGDIGFKQKDRVISNNEKNTTFLNTLINNYQTNIKDDSEELSASEQDKELKRRNLLLCDAQLELTYDEARPFGKLFILVKRDKDSIDSPTLGVSSMHRNAIATIVSDSLIDLARDYLNKNLTALSLELSRKAMSINQWFQSISKAAKSAELLWTVATNPDSKDNFFGEEENIKIVKEYWKEVAEGNVKKLFATPIGKKNTIHIITLRLENTKQTLWFGVENPNFGFELDFNSPWKAYLKHLAEIADTVLFKIQVQQNQVETTSYQAMATMATTTGTIVHQLVNMTRNNEIGFRALYESIMDGDLVVNGNEDEDLVEKAQLYKDLVVGLKDSGEQMLELTQAFREITKFSEERPCNLLQASEKAEKLFLPALTQNTIFTKMEIDPGIIVDVPFHVAALTLANLFSNSKDALKGSSISDRRIWIKTVEEDSSIICSFIDNGPGIPPFRQPEMFKLGKTSKEGGSGWGLYLIKRALRENGGDIELKYSAPGHTEFNITFPKVTESIIGHKEIKK